MGKEKQRLEDFDLPQLQLLFKHIGLGRDHLKSLLTRKQLADLLKWGELCDEDKKQIFATKVEKFGSLSLIINTILTSTFGAWMGLSGCIGSGLGSYKALAMISLIAFVVSGLIGYISLNISKQHAKLVIDNQRLLNLQRRILEVIMAKINQKIEEQIHYLNAVIFILKRVKSPEEKPCFTFTKVNETYAWLEKLESELKCRIQELEESTTDEFYQRHMTPICYQMKKTFAKHIKYLENLSLTQRRLNKRLQTMPSLSFLKILTNPAYGTPKYRFPPGVSWTKNNVNQLLLGLIPTIWGGFASMFVFVGGIPTIARELGFTSAANFLTQPHLRLIEIALALLVTCYFAFSFLYGYKKNWQRQHLIDCTSKEVSSLETLLLENTHKLNTLYKIKAFTQKIVTIFNTLKFRDSANKHISSTYQN